MKKTEPLLIDLAYRESFRDRGYIPVTMRDALVRARRFVLDDGMSAFLGDLSYMSFLEKAGPERYPILDRLRTSARLPHAATWIEFDQRITRKHIIDQNYHRGLAPPNEVVARTGWLLEQHPKIDTSFRLSIIQLLQPTGPAITLPVGFTWTCDESLVAWGRPDIPGLEQTRCSLLGLGIHGYLSNHVEYAIVNKDKISLSRQVTEETAGTLRYVWSLLSVINDIPVTSHYVEGQGSFFAKGKVRPFLDHHTITLKVPGSQSMRRLAARLVVASRRRGHQVRGHFRKDWRHPGERLWIHEHVRGDASLGFVTHDYAVEKTGDNS